MPFPINTINMLILGHVLTYLAIFLNYQDGNKTGVTLGILALVAAYFHEMLYSYGTHSPWLAPALNITAILMVMAAYLLWFS